MNRFALLLLLVFAAACAPTGARQSGPLAGITGTDLAFSYVSVIDVADGSLHPDRTVLIAGNRITAIGPTGSVPVPAEARVIEARGKYLIPGLWDMHVHSATSTDWHFPLFLAHGVTGVRNMHTSVDTALELTGAIKRRLAEGTLQGPRFLANGAVIDGPVPIYPGSVGVGTPEAARAAVDSLAAAGADFLKVYNRLPREVYFAIAGQAGRRGIPYVGHVPNAVRVAEAANAGQRSIEHLDALNFDCSTLGDSVRSVRRTQPPSSYQDFVRLQATLARTWSAERCAPVIAALRRNGTWFVPTMVVFWAVVHPDSVLMDTAAIALTPPDHLRGWEAGSRQVPDELRSANAALLETGKTAVSALHRAGVHLLAGTDLGNPLLVPGHSLHKELELLVAAGLRPLEALRTATLEPARFLEATDSLGTIEPGKLADLVLLDADPLKDIRNTQRIHAVVLNGRYLDRRALDELLARSEAEASRP